MLGRANATTGLHYLSHLPRERSPLRYAGRIRQALTIGQVAAAEQRRMLDWAQGAVLGAEAAVLGARRAYVQACREIGEANRGISRGLRHPALTAWHRRSFKSIAFRAFNARLRGDRAAHTGQAVIFAAKPWRWTTDVLLDALAHLHAAGTHPVEAARISRELDERSAMPTLPPLALLLRPACPALPGRC